MSSWWGNMIWGPGSWFGSEKTNWGLGGETGAGNTIKGQELGPRADGKWQEPGTMKYN